MYEGQSFSRKYTDYCEQRKRRRSRTRRLVSVSYTHLTLPTIYSV